MSHDYSVSVVIPFFNGNDFINDTVISVLANKYIDEIIIVVDHDSEDPKLFLNDYRIIILHNSLNIRGAGVVRSIGYNFASSRYVAFIDSDDLWSSDKIEVQLEQMVKKNYCFCFHNYINFHDSTDPSLGHMIRSGGSLYDLDSFLKKKFTIGCLTVLIDKFVVKNILPNNLKKRNDYFLWFEIIKFLESNNIQWGAVNVNGAYHRLHDNALTNSKISSALHYLKFLRKINIPHLFIPKYFIFYLINTIRSRFF